MDAAQLAADAVAVTALKSSIRGLHIGAGKSLGAATFWADLIDDVRLYNLGLSTEEIQELAS